MNIIKSITHNPSRFTQGIIREPIYPILFSLYPSLYFLSNNIDEVGLLELVSPILLSLIGSILGYLLLNSLLRDWIKSALILLLLQIIWFYHGVFHNIIGEGGINLGFINLGADEFLIAVYVATILLISVLILRLKLTAGRITQVINLSVLILTVFPIINIVSGIAANHTEDAVSLEPLNVRAEAGSSNQHDIYYIILDRYTGELSLEELYHENNLEFYSYLEDKGFQVNYKAFTNYPKTYLSLASTLNMDYLSNLLNSDDPLLLPTSYSTKSLYAQSRVVSFLKDRGYTTISIPSWFDRTREDLIVDRVITSEDRGLVKYDDFETRFWSETLYPVIMRQFSPELAGDDFETTHRRWAQYQFGAFEQVYDVEGPKFVLAHILLPHPPFVFDANCGPKRDTAQNSNDRAEQYIAQMNCANEYTSNLIKDLLNKSDNEPIIILQADEGSDAVTLNSDRERYVLG